MERSHRRSLRTAMLGSTLIAAAILVGGPSSAQTPVPNFEVLEFWGPSVNGDGWTGTEVTVAVYDGGDPNPVWSDQFGLDGNQFWGGLPGIEGFGPGWSVTVTGDNGSKSLDIPLLTVDRVDTGLPGDGLGTLQGTADPGLGFVVRSCADGPSPCNEVTVVNDATEDWASDPLLVDDLGVGARFTDLDGDSYSAGYIWPGVRYQRWWQPSGLAHQLQADMFAADTEITFVIDGPGAAYDQTVTGRTDDGGNLGLDLAGPEMVTPIDDPSLVGSGWTFAAETDADGWTIRKALTAVDLTIDSVDQNVGTATGICQPGTTVTVDLLRGEWFSDDVGQSEFTCTTGSWAETWTVDETRVPDVRPWTQESDNDRFEVLRNRPQLSYSTDFVNGATLGFHMWDMTESTTLTITDPAGGVVWTGSINDDVVGLPGEPDRYDLPLDTPQIDPDWTFRTQSTTQVKTLVVTPLTIDLTPEGIAAINEFGEVTGTAPADTRLVVWLDHGEQEVWSDADGNWAFGADFEGMDGFTITLPDHDGDWTQVEAPLTTGEEGDPWLLVGVNSDVVRGDFWPEGAGVHLTIDDPDTTGEGFEPDYEADTSAEGGGHGNVFFWLAGEFDVRPGHLVTLATDGLTMLHEVQPIEVTEIDVDFDVVHGTAVAVDEVWVFLTDHPEEVVRLVSVGIDGTWTADFSVPGTEGFEQGTADLRRGTTGGATEHDPVNTGETEFEWRVPNPRFTVEPLTGTISGSDWVEGTDVTIAVDDPDTPDAPDFEEIATVERFDPWEPPGFGTGINPDEFPILPGFLVTVSDGVTEKDHVVTGLEISAADAEADLVEGFAEGGTEVMVFVHSDEGGQERQVVAETDGTWTADFTTGEEPFDLQPGHRVDAAQTDEDDDATTAYWDIVGPRLTADQFDDVVRLDWPAVGVTFDVTVAPLADGSSWATTTTTEQVGEFPWETGLLLDLYVEGRDVVTGTIIEVTDPGTGDIVRSLEVSALTVTDLDSAEGAVLGRASPGATVGAWLGNSTGGAWRVVEADGNGEWIAHHGRDPGEFGEEGDGVVGDVAYRFEVGFGAEEPDEDGDATVVRWENYRIGGVSALPDDDIVFSDRWTGLWPATLTVERDGAVVEHVTDIPLDRGPSAAEIDGEPIVFDVPEWENHFALRLGIDLSPGDVVTVGDGLYTGTTVVGSVAVAAVDLDADVVSGTAAADELVIVFTMSAIPGEQFSNARFTCAGADGSWSVDFGEPVVGPIELGCLPEGAAPPLGPGEEIPASDISFDTVVRGLASTTDSQNPFGNEPDDDDGTAVTWWTHLTGLDATPALAEVGETEVAFTATIGATDPADPRRHAVHATVDWGDGTTTSLAESALVPGPDGDVPVAATHTYDAADVETIVVTVEFADGHTESDSFRYVVVHDPDDGFVTGAGWIRSPAGAYQADPSLEGKASFGFVAKYKKHDHAPSGNTQFTFKAGDMRFRASSYDWLVVIGDDRALFRGEGTVNGEPGYGFMVTATDGDPETFRIRITGPDGTVYDNRLQTDEYGFDGTELGGGSIVVHTR